MVASPDDDSSATLLEGGSMSEPLGESPLDEEMSLPLEPGELEPLPETSLLLSSASLELGSIELDDGAALERERKAEEAAARKAEAEAQRQARAEAAANSPSPLGNLFSAPGAARSNIQDVAVPAAPADTAADAPVPAQPTETAEVQAQAPATEVQAASEVPVPTVNPVDAQPVPAEPARKKPFWKVW